MPSRAAVALMIAMFAAEPRRARQDQRVFSPNHRFILLSSVKERSTTVVRADFLKRPLWALPLFLPLPFLSEDGRCIASAYEGGNILALQVKPSDALITFYCGASQVAVPVAAVIPEMTTLRETSDGRVWGRFVGFVDDVHFVLHLESHQELVLDARTGNVTLGRPAK